MDLTTLNGPGLVNYYNRIAAERGLPLVKRFASPAVGRRRCEALINGPATATNVDTVFTQFKTSVRKNRGKLLQEMHEHKNTQLSLGQLIRAIYGAANLGRRGAMQMVLRGLQKTIKEKRLPYIIKKTKSETGAISYGFYDQT